MNSKYFVDANIFITAYRIWYPFDLAPSFWDQLVHKAADRIVIIEQIEKELLVGNDLLVEWYQKQCSNFTVLKIPEPEVILAYKKLINYVNNHETYRQSAKDEFARVADSWLCAYALAYGSTIVTLEALNRNEKTKIKIPNICEEFNIRYINLQQFMRDIGIRL